MVYFLLSLITALVVFGILFWALGLKSRRTGSQAALHSCSSGRGQCHCHGSESGHHIHPQCQGQKQANREHD